MTKPRWTDLFGIDPDFTGKLSAEEYLESNRDRVVTRLQDVLDFIHELQAKSEAQDADDADLFIVCTFDPESDHRHYDGPFAHPIEAFQWANTHGADINAGLGPHEKPYVVTVEFLMKVVE